MRFLNEFYANRILTHSILSEEEERALGARILEGDQDAMDELVLRNQRLVLSIARDAKWLKIDLEERVSCGNVGLIEASKRFDYRKNVKFSTYSSFYIKRFMYDDSLKMGHAISLPQELSSWIRKMNNAIADLGEDASVEELMDYTGASNSCVVGYMVMMRYPVTLDKEVATTSGSKEISAKDEILCEWADSSSGAGVSMAERVVSNYAKMLSPKSRDILLRHYGIGVYEKETLESVGNRYGLSRQRSEQIVKRAIKDIRHKIKSEELTRLALSVDDFSERCLSHE